MFFAFGAALLSQTVLLPQFLQTLMGYTAETAGMVLSASAVLLLFIMPVVGRLTARFQARHLLAFGWIAMTLGMCALTYLSVFAPLHGCEFFSICRWDS
jgi:MFS transporter, DHA2 family, multidrug resistance protein